MHLQPAAATRGAGVRPGGALRQQRTRWTATPGRAGATACSTASAGSSPATRVSCTRDRVDARHSAVMKLRERWYSPRVQSDVTVVRWGHFGRPVIVFPTAGGDAEEIERMRVIDSLGDLIDAGRIKVYSCDSIAGYAMVRGDGSPRYRAALLDGFHHFVRDEMIPAIWADCS